MLKDIFTGLALLLVIEGMLPFISPNQWKTFIHQLFSMPDRVLRMMGFISMLAGVLLLYIIN